MKLLVRVLGFPASLVLIVSGLASGFVLLAICGLADLFFTKYETR